MPALPIAVFHMYGSLRALQYSRWLAAPVDGLLSVADQWLTVVVLLIYLSLVAPRKPAAERRKAA